jgi:hypothetical protein
VFSGGNEKGERPQNKADIKRPCVNKNKMKMKQKKTIHPLINYDNNNDKQPRYTHKKGEQKKKKRLFLSPSLVGVYLHYSCVWVFT